jgi:hypothetical protein
VSELQVLPSRASGRDRRHSRECLSGGSEWCARRYVVVRGGLCAAAGGASPRVDRRLEVTVVQRAGGHSLGDAGQLFPRPPGVGFKRLSTSLTLTPPRRK